VPTARAAGSRVSGDPGRLARLAYTYLHLPIAAGIIVTAVADELVRAHPLHAENAAIATILGGPALYLLGTTSFKWATNERRLPPLSHLAGLLLLCALAPFAFAHLLSAATWETIALRGTGPGRAES
jgi:low temperature requirement protein LtrA